MRKYHPTSGDEGYGFMDNFCFQCIRERWTHYQELDRDEDKCEIMTRAMCLKPTDPEYPSEWTYDTNGQPTCTAWKKWDWGSDDDGRNDRPPVEPEDPMQLMLFSVADEILNTQNSGYKEGAPLEPVMR
jgi:hypothetical protein